MSKTVDFPGQNTISYVYASVLLRKAAMQIVRTGSTTPLQARNYEIFNRAAEVSARDIFGTAVNSDPVSDWSLLSRLEEFRREVAFVTLSRALHEDYLAEASPQKAKKMRAQEKRMQNSTLHGYFWRKSAALFELSNDELFMVHLNERNPGVAREFTEMIREFRDKPSWSELSSEEKLEIFKHHKPNPRAILQDHEETLQECDDALMRRMDEARMAPNMPLDDSGRPIPN